MEAPETWLEAPETWLETHEAWLEAPEAWLEAPEAWLEAREAWLGGTDGRTDRRTHKIPLFYRTSPPSGPLPKKGGKAKRTNDLNLICENSGDFIQSRISLSRRVNGPRICKSS